MKDVTLTKMKNLKSYFCIIFLFFNNVFLAQQDIYERFIEDVGMIEPMVNFVNNFIDDIEKAREERPDKAKWENVKKSMDYSYFKESVLENFKKNYTEDEIRKIYIDNEKRKTDSLEYKPKPGMAQELYDIGGYFGGTLDLQVQTILGENVERLDKNYSSFKGINSDQLSNDWKQGDNEGNYTFYFVMKSKNNVMTYDEIIKDTISGKLKQIRRGSTEFYLSAVEEKWNENSLYFKKKYLDEQIGKYIVTRRFGTYTVLNFLDNRKMDLRNCKSSTISKVLITKADWSGNMELSHVNCFE